MATWQKYLGWLVEVRPETAAWNRIKQQKEAPWHWVDFHLGDDVTPEYAWRKYRYGGTSKWKQDREKRTRVILGGKDAFLHTLIVGPTGSGKSESLLKPIAVQALQEYVKGNRIGLTIIEPKGDLVHDIADICHEAQIPVTIVDPTYPDSTGFNPLVGNPEEVAEMVRTVLERMFGSQEAFFSMVQQVAARNLILLLKHTRGNNVTLVDVASMLRDDTMLKQEVNNYKHKFGTDLLTEYFDKEVMGNEKFREFALGLRLQLEDLVANSQIRRILTKENPLDLDRLLDKGGVLVVNTAIGMGKVGDTFGQFVLMSLQNAVFRRPGTEHTRTPHYLIVDELPRYLNPDLERLLNIGRSYRCACFLSLQSLSQLNQRGSDKEMLIAGCRNKIIFGGITIEDAERFSKELGAEDDERVTRAFEPGIIMDTMDKVSKMETQTPRFTPTQLMETTKYHFVHRIVKDNQLQLPGVACGRLAPPVTVPDGYEPTDLDPPVFVMDKKAKNEDMSEVSGVPEVQTEPAATADSAVETLEKPENEIPVETQRAVVIPESKADNDEWFLLSKPKKTAPKKRSSGQNRSAN